MMICKHDISRNATKVIRRLRAAGYDAYIVGGAVRDLLLDRVPKDYDVATSAHPAQVKRVFGRQARIIGRRFRLVHVYFRAEVIEVSTFRRMPSVDERKGRDTDSGLIVWRDNCFGSLEDDAFRRDFTINALYYDPFQPTRTPVDLIGGLPDLKTRLIRTIGPPKIRLAEDPVRMLRACILAGQYDFSFDAELATEIEKSAQDLESCSRLRLLEEIFKILKRPYVHPIFQACHESGILKYLLPALGERWESDTGKHCQNLLKIRDQKLREDKIFPSRVTGFTTMLLPFLEAELGDGDETQPLWINYAGIERRISSEITEFLAPYPVPRRLVAKIRDVILLQPKFLNSSKGKRIRKHAEYRRGKDTFQIYTIGSRQRRSS